MKFLSMVFNPVDPCTLFTCGPDPAVRIYDLNGNGNADSNTLGPNDALEMASGRSRKTPNRGSVSKHVSCPEYSGVLQVFWTRSVHSRIITHVHVNNRGMIVSKSNVGDIFAWLPRSRVISDALDVSDEDPACDEPVIPVARLRTGSKGPRRIALDDKELLVATTEGVEVYERERVVEECVADGTRSRKLPKMDFLAPEEDLVTFALSGEGRDAELIAVTRNGKLIRFSRHSTSGRRRPTRKTRSSAVHVETPPASGNRAIVLEKETGIMDVEFEGGSTSTNTFHMYGAVSGVEPLGQLPGVESFPSHKVQGFHTNGRSSEHELVDVLSVTGYRWCRFQAESSLRF